MILKETLRIVVKSQAKELLIIDYGVPREKLTAIDLSLPYAILITGVRRCGKSTLLRQLIPRVPHYFYFNFEDTRLVNFSVEDFQRLNEVFLEESLELKGDYILKYKADVLVMGDDWTGKFDEFRDICKVVYLPRTPSISTTAVIEKIRIP